MTYFFMATTITLIIYMILTRERKQPPELIARATDRMNIYSIYRHGGKYTLQTLIKSFEKPAELFTVYINQNTATKLINGKSIINKLYTQPINGLVHYAKPDEGISELRSPKDISLTLPERFNPFSNKININKEV